MKDVKLYTFTFNKANISYGKISFSIEDEGGNLGFVTPSTNKNDCEPDHLFFLMVAPTHSATFYAQRKSQEIFLYVHKNKCVTLQWSISATFDHSWAKSLFYQECGGYIEIEALVAGSQCSLMIL